MQKNAISLNATPDSSQILYVTCPPTLRHVKAITIAPAGLLYCLVALARMGRGMESSQVNDGPAPYYLKGQGRGSRAWGQSKVTRGRLGLGH